MMDSEPRINIRLFASLKKYTPVSSEKYTISPEMTVRCLLKQLGLPTSEVKLIFINGEKGELSSVLSGGERVGIFPPVGGG
jgi:molybdopterin converting factor small subunit